MEAARVAANSSPDPDTRVGAAIVSGILERILSSACNTLPDGVGTDGGKRLLRPEKYYWIEHAERRAIYLACKEGRSLEGGTIFISGGFPCADCARAIIQCGIVGVFSEYEANNVHHWRDHYLKSKVMLQEAGVRVDVLER
jgi:dCMP deaminase